MGNHHIIYLKPDIFVIVPFALLAEAIIDLPEYLTDKIGKMRLDIPEHTITGSLDEIGNALNVISESI